MNAKIFSAMRIILLALILISLASMAFLYFRNGAFDYLNVFFLVVLFIVYLVTKRKAI